MKTIEVFRGVLPAVIFLVGDCCQSQPAAEETPVALVRRLPTSGSVVPLDRELAETIAKQDRRTLPALEQELRLGIEFKELNELLKVGGSRRAAVVQVLALMPGDQATELLVRSLADPPDNYGMRYGTLQALKDRTLSGSQIMALLRNHNPEVVLAGIAHAGATAPTAELTSSRWWLRAAAQHTAGIAPQSEAGVWPARENPRTDILAEVLWLQVKASDVDGALAAAKRYAPQLLRYVAHAQAVLGDTSGALATVSQIADAKEKRGALGSVADGLIKLGKLADARRVLNDRPGDELTASLYEMLARAQAKAGDLAGTQASIKDISDAPVGDGLNNVRRADAHVALAAAQARAGNRQAYRESLAAARLLTQGFRPPYEDNTLVKIVRAQADAGDYEAATATLNTLDPKERARFPDLVLAAQVKRGDMTPAQALAKVFGYSPVYEAAMEVQLAAKDHKAAAQTLKIAKGQDFLFSDIPTRIVNGFLTAADVDGAASFVGGLTDPVMRAQLYGNIAAQRADAGDRPSYQSLMAKAIASAMHVVDQRPGGASARPRKSEVLGQLAQIQAAAKDFEGAKKTIAPIEAPDDRRTYEIQLQARELAAAGRLEDTRAWVASLPKTEDRAQACLTVAMQLMPTPKRP